jgi:hypothetical protein
MELARLVDRLCPASRLADDVEAVVGQQARQGIPGEGVVVDDQDALRHAMTGFCR